MLSEVLGVYQVKGEGRRRWFRDASVDLIVWYDDDGDVEGFQFCFDRGRDEHAFMWTRRHAASFFSVDSGEDVLGMKMSPTFTHPSVSRLGDLRNAVLSAAGELETAIRELVMEKVDGYLNNEPRAGR